MMKTIVLKEGYLEAAEIIKNGGLCAVPTETVYGLAANGLDEAAVERIYEVKGRPEWKPINLLVTDIAAAEAFTEDIPEAARVLAEKFWPGPLTMIFKKKKGAVPDVVTAGGDTVGVRCPAHEMTLGIIKAAGVPLAAPSANMSGEKSPKNALDVIKVFDGRIECVVDGGECSVGVESTIVDMTVWPPRILRKGGLSAQEMSRALNTEVT